MKLSTSQKIMGGLAVVVLYACLWIVIALTTNKPKKYTLPKEPEPDYSTLYADKKDDNLRLYYAVKLTEEMRADIPGCAKCWASGGRKELMIKTYGAATPNSIYRRIGRGKAASLGFTSVTIDDISYEP